MAKYWTPEEDQFLRNHYNIEGPSYCAKELGRTVQSVSYRAGALGIRKSKKELIAYPDWPCKVGDKVEIKMVSGPGKPLRKHGKVESIFYKYLLLNTGKYHLTVHKSALVDGCAKIKVLEQAGEAV